MKNKFKPLMHGMFSAINVNKKLREIWAAIDELDKEINRTEYPVQEAETITEDSAETLEFVAFDWETSDDAKKLKEYALLELGLSIKGNKSADTVRGEIRAFLQG